MTDSIHTPGDEVTEPRREVRERFPNPCTCPDTGGPWEPGWRGESYKTDACCRWHGQPPWRRDDDEQQSAVYRALMPLIDTLPDEAPAIIAFHPRVLAHRIVERLEELHYELRYVGPGVVERGE